MEEKPFLIYRKKLTMRSTICRRHSPRSALLCTACIEATQVLQWLQHRRRLSVWLHSTIVMAGKKKARANHQRLYRGMVGGCADWLRFQQTEDRFLRNPISFQLRIVNLFESIDSWARSDSRLPFSSRTVAL